MISWLATRTWVVAVWGAAAAAAGASNTKRRDFLRRRCGRPLARLPRSLATVHPTLSRRPADPRRSPWGRSLCPRSTERSAVATASPPPASTRTRGCLRRSIPSERVCVASGGLSEPWGSPPTAAQHRIDRGRRAIDGQRLARRRIERRGIEGGPARAHSVLVGGSRRRRRIEVRGPTRYSQIVQLVGFRPEERSAFSNIRREGLLAGSKISKTLIDRLHDVFAMASASETASR